MFALINKLLIGQQENYFNGNLERKIIQISGLAEGASPREKN